jgi:hypothetical protein
MPFPFLIFRWFILQCVVLRTIIAIFLSHQCYFITKLRAFPSLVIFMIRDFLLSVTRGFSYILSLFHLSHILENYSLLAFKSFSLSSLILYKLAFMFLMVSSTSNELTICNITPNQIFFFFKYSYTLETKTVLLVIVSTYYSFDYGVVPSEHYYSLSISILFSHDRLKSSSDDTRRSIHATSKVNMQLDLFIQHEY